MVVNCLSAYWSCAPIIHVNFVSVWHINVPGALTDPFAPLKSKFNKNTTKTGGIFIKSGRGERIRTFDTLVPNQVLYQTELRPEGETYYNLIFLKSKYIFLIAIFLVVIKVWAFGSDVRIRWHICRKFCQCYAC